MIPKEKLEGLRVDMQAVAELAAATGVSYFKGAFRKKSFDGEPWPAAKIDQAEKRRRGSLMVDSAALMNSGPYVRSHAAAGRMGGRKR